jgi:hypothetical protein
MPSDQVSVQVIATAAVIAFAAIWIIDQFRRFLGTETQSASPKHLAPERCYVCPSCGADRECHGPDRPKVCSLCFERLVLRGGDIPKDANVPEADSATDPAPAAAPGSVNHTSVYFRGAPIPKEQEAIDHRDDLGWARSVKRAADKCAAEAAAAQRAAETAATRATRVASKTADEGDDDDSCDRTPPERPGINTLRTFGRHGDEASPFQENAIRHLEGD